MRLTVQMINTNQFSFGYLQTKPEDKMTTILRCRSYKADIPKEPILLFYCTPNKLRNCCIPGNSSNSLHYIYYYIGDFNYLKNLKFVDADYVHTQVLSPWSFRPFDVRGGPPQCGPS